MGSLTINHVSSSERRVGAAIRARSLHHPQMVVEGIRRMIAPSAINQPARERAVRGVSCQGKAGINKSGNKKTKAAPMVNKPPRLISNLFNQRGSVLFVSVELGDT